MKEVKTVLFVTRSMLGVLGVSQFVERCNTSVSAICVFPNIPRSLTSSTTKMKKMSDRMAWQVIAYKLFETYVYYAFRWLTGKTTLGRLARKNKIPLLNLQDPNDAKSIEKIKSFSPDLIVNLSPAFLKKEVLNLPSLGCVNFHGGKLPEYRGVANYFWSLILGAEQWTVTLHWMGLGIDEGNILKEATIPVSDTDSVHSINKKLILLCSDMLESLLMDLKKENVEEKPQAKIEEFYRSFPTPLDIRVLRKRGRKIMPLSHFMESVWAT